MTANTELIFLLKVFLSYRIFHYPRINATETKVIVFRPKNNIDRCSETFINSSKVEYVKEGRSLNVFFLERLTPDSCMQFVLPIICKHFIMNKHMYTLPTLIKNTTYKARLAPALTHFRILLRAITKQNLQKLINLRRSALRLIANAPWCTHIQGYHIIYRILRITAYNNYRLPCLHRMTLITHSLHILKLFKLTKHAT